MIKIPKQCLICGSKLISDLTTSGFNPNINRCYECGAVIKFNVIANGIYQLIIKNCSEDENRIVSWAEKVVAAFRKAMVRKTRKQQ
jgi:recombinational DNA repair protein (RecF pathway)